MWESAHVLLNGKMKTFHFCRYLCLSDSKVLVVVARTQGCHRGYNLFHISHFSAKWLWDYFWDLCKDTTHFPGSSDGKASAYNVGDLGSIPGLGRSPGEGNGNPLQYSCLENLACVKIVLS